jgi:serine/tyrosine/threonine adenylyltransferase
MAKKLGLSSAAEPQLISQFLTLLEAQTVDFTLGFRRLSQTLHGARQEAWLNLFANTDPATAWLQAWQEQLPAKPWGQIAAAMDAVNPLYIPRNHKVEEAIAAAYEGDLGLMHALILVLREPYTEQSDRESYALPAPSTDEPYRTFCGT